MLSTGLECVEHISTFHDLKVFVMACLASEVFTLHQTEVGSKFLTFS